MGARKRRAAAARRKRQRQRCERRDQTDLDLELDHRFQSLTRPDDGVVQIRCQPRLFERLHQAAETRPYPEAIASLQKACEVRPDAELERAATRPDTELERAASKALPTKTRADPETRQAFSPDRPRDPTETDWTDAKTGLTEAACLGTGEPTEPDLVVIEPSRLVPARAHDSRVSWRPQAARRLASLVRVELESPDEVPCRRMRTSSRPGRRARTSPSAGHWTFPSLPARRPPVRPRVRLWRVLGLSVLGTVAVAAWVARGLSADPTERVASVRRVLRVPAQDAAVVQVEPSPAPRTRAVQPPPQPAPAPTPVVPAAVRQGPDLEPPASRVASGDQDVDDLFGGRPAEPLTAAAIVAGVRRNTRSVGPCLKTAHRRGELSTGRHRFVLDWTIMPNGMVTRPRLTGPESVLDTSLPACLVSVMTSWRFPPSERGGPVKNFPFQFTVQ